MLVSCVSKLVMSLVNHESGSFMKENTTQIFYASID